VLSGLKCLALQIGLRPYGKDHEPGVGPSISKQERDDGDTARGTGLQAPKGGEDDVGNRKRGSHHTAQRWSAFASSVFEEQFARSKVGGRGTRPPSDARRWGCFDLQAQRRLIALLE
jgi:hypothetical protein